MYVTTITLAALWGAAVGLLVPRAAYRLSVAFEEPWRDRCPVGHVLVGPARGWLGGPGRQDCATTGSPRAAPLLTASVCAVLAAAAGGPRPELAVWLLGAPFAVLLATVDARVHRLPDALTLPLAAAVPLLLGVAELLPYDAGSWLHALLGALALGGAYLVLHLINPGQLGLGDVKLALPLGAALGWYGWGVLFAGAFAGFLLGAVYGLGLVALRRADRSSAIPFGPFMLAGGLLGLLLGAFTALP
ncbi:MULTISPECIES: A24 family peptidase [unclassified Streptomyces]|uniref:prepilin peptidase n=1 Tax=unclassified Streptomyces TaxID=2593676 RepID=UPI001655485D|nr:A24 family peptidase [Streptomyces sp. CB02980]MCB8902851.1 A24 family peptidase [Streptomyces sp. CB02980]